MTSRAQALCGQLTQSVNKLLDCRQSVRTGDDGRAVRELEAALRRLERVKERLNDS